MEICNLDDSGSENQQFKEGQVKNRFAANFSNSESLPHSNTTVCKGFGYDKNRKHYKTREGLVKLTHYIVTKKIRW
jgi:hypothetical protein